eukprot:sb/3471943/
MISVNTKTNITPNSAAAVGSMPSSALFFLSYEGIKSMDPGRGARQHMLASSVGETAACLVRVPTEIPFAAIQYPIWEWLKSRYATSGSGVAAGACGSVAGAIAGAITTPIDVVKTRLMLSKERQSLVTIVTELSTEGGWRAFFRGIGPRVGWLSIGGFVYLGSYQTVVGVVSRQL